VNKGRFSSILTWTVLLNCLLVGSAFAGFGFGVDAAGKSGLDFNKGYDVNTVATISGPVVSPPQAGEQGHLIVELKSGGETVSISLGPKSFWEKKAVPLRLNDTISAKGSIAQGKDGKIYLMAQKLTNVTAGTQVELRDEKGTPVWQGGNANRGMSDRPGGGMMRGGGVMRGGGGGMRH
jgi:hypothetical protein